MTAKDAIEEVGTSGFIQYGLGMSSLAKLDGDSVLRWVSKEGVLGKCVPLQSIINSVWVPYVSICSNCVIYKELIVTANYGPRSTMKRLLHDLKKQQCTNKEREECK